MGYDLLFDLSEEDKARIEKRMKRDRISAIITVVIIIVICLGILGGLTGYAIYCKTIERDAVLYVAYNEGFDLSKLDYTTSIEKSKKGAYVVEIILFPTRETLKAYPEADSIGALHCIVTYEDGDYDYIVVFPEGW